MKVELRSVWRLYALIHDRFPASSRTLSDFLEAVNALASQRGCRPVSNARLTGMRRWKEGVDGAVYQDGIYRPNCVSQEEMSLFLEVLDCTPKELFDSDLLIRRFPSYRADLPATKVLGGRLPRSQEDYVTSA